jgi:hypothetical protein
MMNSQETMCFTVEQLIFLFKVIPIHARFTSIHPYLQYTSTTFIVAQVVVIGSGIGGLYLAALLAKSGRVVVVLEQCPG